MGSGTTREWAELAPITIQRALDGDRAAFTRLYRHYRGIVRGAVAARVRVWPSMTAQMEDILGDVWVQMLANERKALRRYDPMRGEFGYFIKILAASRASSALRRYAGRECQQVPVEPSAEDQIEHVLLQRDFLEALWAKAQPLLKGVDEELFVRVMVMGRETKEVALELGLGQDAAYQRIARLRDKLVRMAGKLFEDEHGASSRPPERLKAIVTHALAVLVLSGDIATDDPRENSIDGIAPTVVNPHP